MLRLYRSLITVFMFCFFGIGGVFVRYFIFPFQKNKSENYKTLQQAWNFFIFLMEFFKLIKLNVSDIEKIKNIKNSIIVSTHPSFIDVVILMSIIPNSTCFVAGKIRKNPFFKGMAELLFINEDDEIENWLNDAKNKMDEGLNIIIFPMGKRHKENEHLRIRRGASLIAEKTKKNMVLISIKEDVPYLQRSQAFYDAGDRVVNFSIKYLCELKIEEYIKKYDNEVDFRTNLTKKIGEILYQNKI